MANQPHLSLMEFDVANISTPALSFRSEHRAQAILAAATEVFLKRGYAGTSVDDIVKRAAGSKATVYRYFKNKRELFIAVVESVAVRHSQEKLDYNQPDPEKALREFAENRLRTELSASSIALLRLVISEAPRSPEVANAYYGHAGRDTAIIGC